MNIFSRTTLGQPFYNKIIIASLNRCRVDKYINNYHYDIKSEGIVKRPVNKRAYQKRLRQNNATAFSINQ
jgi:hypothetical protein